MSKKGKEAALQMSINFVKLSNENYTLLRKKHPNKYGKNTKNNTISKSSDFLEER